MKLVRILVVNNAAPAIYALRLNGGMNEWRKLFTQWQDREWLEAFFEKNKHLLNGAFYKGISVESAVNKTVEDAQQLEDKMIELFDNAAEGSFPDLDDKFKTLHSKEFSYELVQHKAYGELNQTWLRIYALKVQPNVYIVTGGAIKLTRTMHEAKHTEEELIKLRNAVLFLKEEGLLNAGDCADYFEMI